MCAIMKNEERYLIEWIAYHRAVGVTNFVVYDNESDDGTSELLQSLHDISIVNRVPWLTPDNQSPQLTAYSDFIAHHSASDDFAVFIDADEFLSLPEECGCLSDYFERRGLASLDIGAIAVNQRVFGSSGEKAYRPAYVTERFHMTAEDGYDENKWFKSICRPSYVRGFQSPHCAVLRKGTYANVSGRPMRPAEINTGRMPDVYDGLRVNHYIIKSLGEFRDKQARGGGAAATREGRVARYKDDAFFYGRDAVLNARSWKYPAGVLARTRDNDLEIRQALGKSAFAAERPAR